MNAWNSFNITTAKRAQSCANGWFLFSINKTQSHASLPIIMKIEKGLLRFNSHTCPSFPARNTCYDQDRSLIAFHIIAYGQIGFAKYSWVNSVKSSGQCYMPWRAWNQLNPNWKACEHKNVGNWNRIKNYTSYFLNNNSSVFYLKTNAL